MRVGRGSRAVKTRVLAREGWQRRRCLVEVVVLATERGKGYCHVASLYLQAKPRRHFRCTAAC